MGDQLTNAVKEARSHEMIRVTTATQQAFFKAQIGRTEEVLFEREIQKGVWEGYSMNYTPVAVASGTSLAGEIRSVRIELHRYALHGCRCKIHLERRRKWRFIDIQPFLDEN